MAGQPKNTTKLAYQGQHQRAVRVIENEIQRGDTRKQHSVGGVTYKFVVEKNSID